MEYGVEMLVSEKARPSVTDETIWARLDDALARAGAVHDIEHELEKEMLYETYNENGYGVGEPVGAAWRFQAVGVTD